MDINSEPSMDRSGTNNRKQQYSTTVHKQVENAIVRSNELNKERADKSRGLQNFQEGEMVMVHLKKDRFPAGIYSKLKKRNFGPFEIMK